jgi:hypothetical protein
MITGAKTLEAVYNINKHAKKYAELADENYQKGKGATAKRNSIKKTALYRLKSEVVRRIYDRGDVEHIEKHSIDGSGFLCFFIGEWSFHVPVDSWDGGDVSDEIDGDTRELDDFEKTAEKENSDRSLKASLLHLKDELGVNANDYLPQEKVQYGASSYFAGWKYL